MAADNTPPNGPEGLNLTTSEWRWLRKALTHQLERESRLLVLLETAHRQGNASGPEGGRQLARQLATVEDYRRLHRKVDRMADRAGPRRPAAIGRELGEIGDSLREIGIWLGATCIGAGVLLSILFVFLPLAMWLVIAGAAVFLAGWSLSWPISALGRRFRGERLLANIEPGPPAGADKGILAAKKFSVISSYSP